MSLFNKYVSRPIRRLIAAFAAVIMTASMVLFGVSSSASAEGVVTVGEPVFGCYFLITRDVTNGTSYPIYVRSYSIVNGEYLESTRYGGQLIAPGETLVYYGAREVYLSNAFGVKTRSTDPSGSGDWVDWGAVEYVPPPECPVIAPATLSARNKFVTPKPRTVFLFRTRAVYTELGYRTKGRIKWTSFYEPRSTHAILMGPSLRPGQRTRIKFYYRNCDVHQVCTSSSLIATKTIRRTRR